MQQVLNKNQDRQHIAFLAAMGLLFIGFNGARIFISLGVIALVAQAFWLYPFRNTLGRFFKQPEWWSISCMFLVLLFSGINSANQEVWLKWLRIGSSFVLLPLAFAAFPPISETRFRQILALFSVVMLLSAVMVMGNYLLHFSAVNKTIERGGAVPVPFSHVRYNLLLVFACWVTFYLFENTEGKQRWLWMGSSGLLFVIVHLLASRSGWLALYCGVCCRLFFFLFQSKKKWAASAIIFSLAMVPLLVYEYSDGLQAKVRYMRYDWNEFKAGRIDGRSDAMRMASWQTGVALIKENFWLGTGVGDLPQKSDEKAQQLFPGLGAESRKMPHNEFLWMWAGSGVFGLLLFLFSFFYPFAVVMRRGGWLSVNLFLIFFTSFLSEYPLHEQVGSIFYLSFLLLFINRFQWLK